MPESTMAESRINQFDKTKAYVPEEEEGTAFVSQIDHIPSLPIC